MSESIYTWIKETPPPPPKEPMYHSKHDPKLPPYIASSTFREAAAKKPVGTMGRTVKEEVKPTTFLRAHEKSGVLEATTSTLPKKFERTTVAPERKPSVPKRSEAPLHGLTSGKDFITTNAVSAMLTAPKRLPREEPDWLAKPDYGKAPEYLDRVKKDIEAEHEYIMSLLDQKQMEEESASGVRMRELTTGEREELIEALKSKWDTVNAQYQRITFKKISTSNSTTGEIRFKEQCETALAQIEKDIARLSVKAPIFIVDDSAPSAASHAAGATAHHHHTHSAISSGSGALGGAGSGGGPLGSASSASTPGGDAGGRFSATSVMRAASATVGGGGATRSGAPSATSSRR